MPYETHDQAYARGVRDMMRIAAGAADRYEADSAAQGPNTATIVKALRAVVVVGDSLVQRAERLRAEQPEAPI